MKKIISILLIFQVACHQGMENKPVENIPVPVKSDSVDTQNLKYPLKKGANVDSLADKKKNGEKTK
jgi:hypothetical protein